tara:strand:+ start:1733 stop:2449 length:717 start_codon:yes stop_codon:yes gene_type:complete
MIYNKKVLAIITARSGSKGLKAKNIKIFNKKPLICWTVDQAKKSKYIDRVYISTDSKKILSKTRTYNLEIPFLRPRKLSGDKSKSEDVVIFELKRIEKYFNENFDIILLLEPTNPLRYKNDIDKAIKQLAQSKKFSSIIGVSQIKFIPELIYSLNKKNKKINRVFKNLKSISRRQDAKIFFFPNGTIYGVKKKNLLLEKKIYTKNTMGFLNDNSQAKGEIDNIFDFYSTEALFKNFFN